MTASHATSSRGLNDEKLSFGAGKLKCPNITRNYRTLKMYLKHWTTVIRNLPSIFLSRIKLKQQLYINRCGIQLQHADAMVSGARGIDSIQDASAVESSA